MNRDAQIAHQAYTGTLPADPYEWGVGMDAVQAADTSPEPDPQCWHCMDYGLIEIIDASTDALIGHRRCENPPCVERVKKAAEARERAEAHAAVCTGTSCCPPF